MEAPALPSRRDRERLARREAILDAALSVFAERGYEQARLEEVAERAEFGKGTLYNYFEGGKQDLLFAIFERVHGEMRALVEGFFAAEAGRGRPTREVFRDFVAAFVAHLVDNRTTFLVLMKEVQRTMLGDDRGAVERLVALHEQVADAFVPAIDAAIASGAMRPLPARFIGHMVFGSVFDYLMHASFAGGCTRGDEPDPFVSPAAAADALATLLFDGLIPYPDRPFSPSPTPPSPNPA